MSQFDSFLYQDALAINKARQDHLASLNLPLTNKIVLEVGAGIGLHTKFFLDRKCTVTVTDGKADNVEEIKRRLPDVESYVLDLDKPNAADGIGLFDIVYCYGLLYHIGDPESAIAQLANICKEQILLELIVNPSEKNNIEYLTDPAGNNQSLHGPACRPSRAWIVDKLKKYFGYGYITVTQPRHPEFPTNWDERHNHNTRAVFVGSKKPLVNELLSAAIPQQQSKHPE